jgi:hypothetical protein
MWRRRALNEATRHQDFRPAWAIIHEAGQRRDERLRLFGYVKWCTGETISLGEAQGRIRETLKEYPNKTPREIITEFVLEWHNPEAEQDVLESVGEVDCKKDTYPALGLSSGDVLSDPKLRYRHPFLVTH